MKTLIKNGRIIDPSQKLDAFANLLAEDGKIVGLTEEEPEADLVVDTKGHMVTPGFIDIHMHEDSFGDDGILLQNTFRSMLKMGVTTAIGGNCGSNRADPARMLDYIDEHGNTVNLGLFVGHGWLREACGLTDRYSPAYGKLQSRLAEMAQERLDAGCMGVSFGLEYIPGTGTEEILKLAALCTPSGRLVSSHVRGDVGKVFGAVKEMADMAQKTGCRVQISHIGSMGGYGQMKQLLKEIEGYRAAGADMACDCYPYNAFSTYIGSAVYDEGCMDDYQADHSAIMMATGRYAGQRCTKEIFEWERKNAPQDLTIGFLMKEEDVEMALRHPLVMLGSDGMLLGDQGHPRVSGTFSRFIANYVRPGKVGLMEGIAKMTSMPAERLRLPQKGSFKSGCDADIVIFDFERIKDRSTFEEPFRSPAGIDYVLLGGQIACQNGVIIADRLGRSVRYGDQLHS